MKVFKKLFLIAIMFLLIGCKADNKLTIDKSKTAYPKLSDVVARKFAQNIAKGNFKKARQYTFKPNMHGADYQTIRKELDKNFIEIYSRGIQEFGFQTKKK